MKREIIETSKAPRAIGPYSQAIKCEGTGFVFCSGQIALNPDGELVHGDVAIQTRQIIENLKNVLRTAGLELNNVVKTTVFLANMDDFPSMNEVYEEYFAINQPARATVQVSRLPKDVLVEIDAIACM
jgi:2-iminobutanoate/2-iminopropanoate deaminase